MIRIFAHSNILVMIEYIPHLNFGGRSFVHERMPNLKGQVRPRYIIGFLKAVSLYISAFYNGFCFNMAHFHASSMQIMSFEYSNEQVKEWDKFDFFKIAHSLEALTGRCMSGTLFPTGPGRKYDSPCPTEFGQ